MATVNTGNEWVLIIKVTGGKARSITTDFRSVYENTKGRFIKTTDGQIWLDSDNRAIFTYSRWKPEAVSADDAQKALHQLFTDYRLDGFIK